MFCRETVRRLRQLRENDADYPRVVLVHQGSPAEGERFFARHWPRAPAVADPEHRLFDGFSIARGGLKEVLSPGAFASGVRAALRGNGVGKPVGDVWRMPGAFLLHRGRVLWSHEFTHVGDQPDYARIPERLEILLDDSPRARAG